MDPLGFEARAHFSAFGQSRIRIDRLARGKQDHVLTIPPFYCPVLAKLGPEGIEHPESELFKNFPPVRQRLAVDMAFAPLTGRGG